jgi:chromosome segregation ATPase
MDVMAREAWTDERLDDLASKVDRGFERVETDIRESRSEMKAGFDVVNSRFDSMQRMMVIGFVSINASVIASVIGAVVATQL